MKILGVGVDLVNVTRVQKFLTQHSSKRISRLLSPAEKKRYQNRKLSARSFAKIFAAKEAFFKSLGLPWMGLEGFSSMELTQRAGNRFSIKIVSEAFGKGEAEGCFFNAGTLLGAQVIRYAASAAAGAA